MSTVQKYPWLKVTLFFGIICPALASLIFIPVLALGFYANGGSAGSAINGIVFPIAGLFSLDTGTWLFFTLLILGTVVFFSLPFLIVPLFFVGIKVHKGVLAYCFAAGWGAFLGLFLLTFSAHSYHEPGEVHFALMAALSLALAALLVTYWVVPPKATDDGFRQ